jgi:peptidoglycan/xylan/chitin deacetylase (PgdA/CDA1 family)
MLGRPWQGARSGISSMMGRLGRHGNGLPGPAVLRLLLDGLSFSRATRLLGPRYRGLGTILTLHHVKPATFDPEFSPNRILEITPDFLEVALTTICEGGFDLVSLDEARERIIDGGSAKPFVSITLDDGYADNLIHALPVFERHSVPFTIYVTTGLVDHDVNLWWQHLEDVIREHESVTWHASRPVLATRSLAEKHHAFGESYWALRRLPNDAQAAAVADFADRYGIDPADSCRDTALTWRQLELLAANPLVTIGAHTVSHRALSKLGADEAGDELTRSRATLEQRLGVDVRHACYPFGDRDSAASREFELASDLGFATATTTRKGVVTADHRDHLHALPRISLNGDYQEARYVEALLSGLPTALLNRFRRLDVD